MKWLWRKKKKEENPQTVTLLLSDGDWEQIKIEAESCGWAIEYIISMWLRNRLHGVGRIGN